MKSIIVQAMGFAYLEGGDKAVKEMLRSIDDAVDEGIRNISRKKYEHALDKILDFYEKNHVFSVSAYTSIDISNALGLVWQDVVSALREYPELFVEIVVDGKINFVLKKHLAKHFEKNNSKQAE